MSVFSIFGCFGKKSEQPKNIEEWLDQQWKGRFEVLSTPTNFTDKDYYFDKRESVIAEKADREVQFILPWIKNEKDLGLTKEIVEEALSRSRANVSRARVLLEQLNVAGLERSSVGVSHGDAYIFLFAEPSPDRREQYLNILVQVLGRWQGNDPLPCEIAFIEEKKYGEAFSEIIPTGHWARRDSWQYANEIMRLHLDAAEVYDLETLSKQWQFNTLSDRMLTYVNTAYAAVLEWAEKKLPKKMTIEGENMVEFSLDENDGLLIEIDFPYFESANDGESTASGMITGLYHIDKGSFTQIHMVKDEGDQ